MSAYRAKRKIASGGMGEVLLGLQQGLEGFAKLVVIKRIYPHLGEDEHFLRMFFEEARLAASLNHPNIIHIIDFDRDEEGFFIVMEYLSGEPLNYIAKALNGNPLPLPIVCRIVADVADGLHFAHTATALDGTPKGIVHRDVTPGNILVCYNGVTKVLDFGVAKACAADSHTRPGEIKGKLNYLSPELVEQREVDARADVFQLGVVLHEMLTGRRLFDGANEAATLRSIINQPIDSPSKYNPSVPPKLDAIVLAALERDRDIRTASAGVLRQQLDEILPELGGDKSRHAVAEWMHETFATRYEERLRLERSVVQKAAEQAGPDESLPPMFATSSLPDLKAVSTAGKPHSWPNADTRITAIHNPPEEPSSIEIDVELPKTPIGKIIAMGLALGTAMASVLGAGYWLGLQRTPQDDSEQLKFEELPEPSLPPVIESSPIATIVPAPPVAPKQDKKVVSEQAAEPPKTEPPRKVPTRKIRPPIKRVVTHTSKPTPPKSSSETARPEDSSTQTETNIETTQDEPNDSGSKETAEPTDTNPSPTTTTEKSDDTPPELPPDFGFLEIQVPSPAQAFVDGRNVGDVTEDKIKVPVGVRSVVVIFKSSNLRVEHNVTVKGGKTTHLHVEVSQ